MKSIFELGSSMRGWCMLILIFAVHRYEVEHFYTSVGCQSIIGLPRALISLVYPFIHLGGEVFCLGIQTNDTSQG